MLRPAVFIAGVFLTFSVLAQQGVIVYPAKGQSEEQQKADEGACLSWASGQTGFNPTAPIQTSSPPPATQAPTSSPRRGLFGGALLGVAVGAITGHAGEGAAIGAASGALIGGMRRKDQMEQSAAQQDAWAGQQAAEYEQKQSDFNRAYGVCLQGRGYTVSE